MNTNVPAPVPRRSHRQWFKWQHCPRRGKDYLDNVWLQTKYIAPNHTAPAAKRLLPGLSKRVRHGR